MQAPTWEWAGPIGTFPAAPQTVIIILVAYATVSLIRRFLTYRRPLIAEIAELLVIASAIASISTEPTVASLGRGFAKAFTWVGDLIGSTGAAELTNQALAVLLLAAAVALCHWKLFSASALGMVPADAYAYQAGAYATMPMGVDPALGGMPPAYPPGIDPAMYGQPGLFARLRRPLLLTFFGFCVLAASVYIPLLGTVLSWTFFNILSGGYILVVSLINAILSLSFSGAGVTWPTWEWAGPLGTFPALPLPLAIAIATAPIIYVIARYYNPQGRATAWTSDALELLVISSAVAACREVPLVASIGQLFGFAFDGLRGLMEGQAALSVGLFSVLVLVLSFIIFRVVVRKQPQHRMAWTITFSFIVLVVSVNVEWIGSALSWVGLNVISGVYILLISLLNYLLGFVFFEG